MTALSLLDAHEIIARSEVMLQRLNAALGELENRPGLREEKTWLGAAIDRVSRARTGVEAIVGRAMRLPELSPLREEHARTKQQAAVDALEHLQAGIAFHAGPRAPLLEALFAKLKLPVLRRADRQDFEKFSADFEKKLSSGYAKRMLAEESLAPVQTAAHELRAAFADWREAFSGEPLPPDEARELEAQLVRFAEALELPLRQARLLAEAALAPADELFEQSGLAQKPRRRLSRPAGPDAGGAESTE